MQKFSKASLGMVLAFSAMIAANVMTADVVNDYSNGVANQALAFKRRASLTQELRDQFQQINHAVAQIAHEGPSAYLMSGGGSAAVAKPAAKETTAPVSSATKTASSTTTPVAEQSPKLAQDKSANQHTSGHRYSQISSFWQSSSAGKKSAANQDKMKVYSEPSQKSKVLASVSSSQNFSVEQGDWVKIKTSEGVQGWALVKDVEQNITNAWHDEYQVVMNGQSSNYSVTKISAEERKKRQQAMIERQNQRLKRLSALWEQDFFNFDDVDGRHDEIQGLKDQVMALNAQIKELQTVKKETA